MTLSVVHATAADATFSAGGATAWNESHTLSGIASAAQGGTGIAFFTAAGPTQVRVYTFPDSAATMLYSGGPLGTPSSGTATNLSGTAASLSIGGNAATVTTNANLTGPVTSVGNATTIASAVVTEAMQVLADNTTQNFSTSKHGYVPKGTNVGNYLKDDGTWAAVSASVTLNGVLAATGAVTIASGNNTGIVWNWANTSNTTVAMTLGETTAATNGTSTSGIPNQVLLKLATLAASTMSPLQVYSRGNHVFSVSPTASQLLMTDGANATPAIAFASQINTGIRRIGTSDWGFVTNGSLALELTATQLNSSLQFITDPGTATAPAITDNSRTNTGLYWPATGNTMGIGDTNFGEFLRWTNGNIQHSLGSANATGYAMNFRKARGSVASPTVITTGDDLLTIGGFGYLGATNTYKEACRITFDSTGTISDSTSGIGGIMRFLVAAVGSVGVTECFQARAGGLSFPSTGGAPTVGNATLVGGTVTVSTTAVNTGDSVLLTRMTSGGTLGTAITYTISNATSFTITSDSALDTSTFSFVIIKAH